MRNRSKSLALGTQNISAACLTDCPRSTKVIASSMLVESHFLYEPRKSTGIFDGLQDAFLPILGPMILLFTGGWG